MYRLLSAHVLALIDDSVISIKRYIVVQHCRLPPPVPRSRRPLIPSLNAGTSTVDTQVGYACP